MRSNIQKFMYWLPRILAIFGILFLSLFALDVFVEYETLSEIALALVMHLVPSFILIAVTVIAWRWHLVGGILFLALGVFSYTFFNTYENLLSLVTITLPPLVVGFLFFWEGVIDWVYEDDKKKVDAVQ